jgi:hypothetical protein
MTWFGWDWYICWVGDDDDMCWRCHFMSYEHILHGSMRVSKDTVEWGMAVYRRLRVSVTCRPCPTLPPGFLLELLSLRTLSISLVRIIFLLSFRHYLSIHVHNIKCRWPRQGSCLLLHRTARDVSRNAEVEWPRCLITNLRLRTYGRDESLHVWLVK